jgi:phage-related protein (TIGR01555 family)
MNKKVKKEKTNLDSWSNVLTGMGTLKDKNIYRQYTANSLLSENAITALYTDEGIGKKIVNRPIDLMFNAGFKIIGDEKNLINSIFEERFYIKELKRLLKWARAFGGAVLYLAINDNQKDLKQPVNETNIREILFIKAFDRFRVSQIEYNNNLNSKDYGKPLYLTITPIAGTPFTIHSSRCIIVDGEDTCEMTRQNNNGWGLSIYQDNYEALSEIGTMYNALSHIVQGFISDTFKMDNLFQLMMAGKSDLVKERMNLFDLTRHIMNTNVLDKNEEFTRNVSNVSGLSEIVNVYMGYCAAVSGIPIAVLFGRSAAGLNATGENDIKEWYDEVGSQRNNLFSPVLEKIVKYSMFEKQGYFKGKELNDWTIEFGSLYEMSDKEKSEIYNLVSQADDRYIANGTLDPLEVRESRFSGKKFNLNITVDDKK